MGFSHSTCRPARRHAMLWRACRNTGVATYTASAPDSASADSRSCHAGAPYASALRGSRVTIPASRPRGSARMAGNTRLLAISPMPMTSQRNMMSMVLAWNISGAAGGVTAVGRFMRWVVCLPWLFVPGPCKAWDTTPHRRITKAALDALPARLLNRFGKEAAPLVEIYCMYPDRYVEMASYGFVRNSPGPRTVSEISNYCVRPDGELLHGATGDRVTDFGSLQYLFENIVANSSRNRPDDAAKYAGVLSHFIADSLSPPHAVTPERLLDMKPWWLSAGGVNIHSAIEKSLPE